MEQTNFNDPLRELGMSAYRLEILKEKTYEINPKREKKNFFPSPVKLRNIEPQRVYNKRIRDEDLELLDTSSDEEEEDDEEDKENVVVNDDENRKFKRMRYARDGEIYMFTYNKVGYGKEGLVIEHLFKMRYQPFIIGRISVKPKAYLVVDSTKPYFS